MKPFDAQFLPPSKPHWALWLLPLGLALTAIGFTLAAERLREKVEAHQQQAEQRIREERQSERALPPPPEYRASALLFLEGRTEPWGYLVALESMNCPGVLPTSFAYGAESAETSIEAEFSSYESLLQCVETLNAGLAETDKSRMWRVVSTKAANEKSVVVLAMTRSAVRPASEADGYRPEGK